MERKKRQILLSKSEGAQVQCGMSGCYFIYPVSKTNEQCSACRRNICDDCLFCEGGRTINDQYYCGDCLSVDTLLLRGGCPVWCQDKAKIGLNQ